MRWLEDLWRMVNPKNPPPTISEERIGSLLALAIAGLVVGLIVAVAIRYHPYVIR